MGQSEQNVEIPASGETMHRGLVGDVAPYVLPFVLLGADKAIDAWMDRPKDPPAPPPEPPPQIVLPPGVDADE
jgi:hypothetical protein